ISIFAFGRMVPIALNVAEILKSNNLKPYVINLRFAKPLDEDLIYELSQKSKLIVTIEDNVIAGGVGSAILEFLNSKDINLPMLRLGFPDKFIEHGDVNSLFKKYSLDAESIARSILEKYKGLI
ncbi:MAG: transketolase C-terminal domain-containing protein, partial [Thermoanaerobacteraceae bacterium]